MLVAQWHNIAGLRPAGWVDKYLGSADCLSDRDDEVVIVLRRGACARLEGVLLLHWWRCSNMDSLDEQALAQDNRAQLAAFISVRHPLHVSSESLGRRDENL